MSSTKLCTQFTTFRPEGFLSAANASEFLERLTVEVRSSVDSALLVNMEAVEFMDSAGLMALIKAFRLAESLGRRFGICSLAPSVRIMFELTQLDKAFEIFEDRADFQAAIDN
ncbi:STAS domain-containing protein [Waterburya agarophytonicola K14]|uniref:STAS domain-containing protein n=1 Tax=Waterburya agarophytonicola KI4 TaxID=2874699 RepID=A0A964BN94_9CYAN|nr:STAS domain-containing protein [Waterburya agarophytonicola]MCC0175746.1 STAS domain-containing protein [Waterburya agarophytonicola KI4]